jgi:hypothetical protein
VRLGALDFPPDAPRASFKRHSQPFGALKYNNEIEDLFRCLGFFVKTAGYCSRLPYLIDAT